MSNNVTIQNEVQDDINNPDAQMLSDEQIEKDVQRKLLTPHLLKLMFDEPFFATLVRDINFEITTMGGVIPTAGVFVKDGYPHMAFAPEFFKKLTSQHVKGILKHECFHLIYEHCTKRTLTPHSVANIAQDAAINSDISEDELPQGGVIPGKPFGEGPLSDLIAKLPKHKSAEWYFTRIMQDEEAKQQAISQYSNGTGFDIHDLFGNMSDEEKELFSAKMKDAVERAIKECDKTGKWGTISSDMRARLREIVSREVPWQDVLRQFTGLTRRGSRTTTWSNINVVHIDENYGPLSPGSKRGFTSSIAVFIDQSGSVSDKELQVAFGELESLARHTGFVTYHFDTSVDEKSETVWKKRRSMGATRTRCGGTDFQCVTDFMHKPENRSRFDGYIIISDGEAAKPTPSKIKRCYLITPPGKLLFEPDGLDYVAKMKWPENTSDR